MSILLKKVLDLANKEVGYKEKPVNLTKYGEWADKNKFTSFKLNGNPWCYTFVSWVLMFSGCKEPFYAYVPAGYDYYRKTGKLFKTPLPGDLIFFDFNNDGIPEHIGFCESLNLNKKGQIVSINTIEGNTSSGVSGSQDNGDGVFKRVRNLSLIKGFGRPDYNVIIEVKPEPKKATVKNIVVSNIKINDTSKPKKVGKNAN